MELDFVIKGEAKTAGVDELEKQKITSKNFLIRKNLFLRMIYSGPRVRIGVYAEMSC